MMIEELRKIVNEIPPEMDKCQVILQKDSEGNGYSPLHGVDAHCIYVAETDYSGTVHGTDWTADESCLEEEDWEEMKNNNKNKCVVLFPVN